MRETESDSLRIVEIGAHGCWGEAEQTSYVTSETKLVHDSRQHPRKRSGRVGTLPCPEQHIFLRRGDQLLLGDEYTLVVPAKYAISTARSSASPRSAARCPPSFATPNAGSASLRRWQHYRPCVQVHQDHLELESFDAGKDGAKLRRQGDQPTGYRFAISGADGQGHA